MLETLLQLKEQEPWLQTKEKEALLQRWRRKMKEYGVLIEISHTTLRTIVGSCMKNPRAKIGDTREVPRQAAHVAVVPCCCS